ncbi:hypothetical protein FNF27_07949 [Cafeteria roenbergensis]|uniref:Orn/DAP/Arg decarboxylase 2 C-terminal domain-containing protein n=1 Tax=Cafeteria roenbergensis TaxID=33653 RepID=A0A5A8DDG0_CAFRO|nr:hypothetical protein FNF27_07949 [Cafeteria roenbergensis]
MYTSNFTSKADLLTAARQGVVINLDDISLVEDLAGVCKGAGLPFPKLICFRFNPGLGRTDSETASNVLGGPDAKFGVPREDLLAAYSRAKALGATRFGLHMMTGSCVMSDDYWTETRGGEAHPEDADDPAAEPLNVVGTLCENNDWFAKQRPLPASAGVGDLFVVHDSGAHSHSMGFQYNGKLRAPELLLRRRAGPGAPAVVQRVRERETIASLFAETSIPADLGAPLRLDTPAAATRAEARDGEAPTRKMFVWAALAAAGAAAAVATALAMTRARQTA